MMTKYKNTIDAINGGIKIIEGIQHKLVVSILKDNGGTIGGCIGSIIGAHGHYDLESIYIDEDKNKDAVMCHLDYPAFEVDADFQYLSIDERQQIIKLLITETQKL